MRWLDGLTDAVDVNLGEPQEAMRDREPCAAVHGAAEPDMSGQLSGDHSESWTVWEAERQALLL